MMKKDTCTARWRSERYDDLTIFRTHLKQSVGGYDNGQGGKLGEFEVWIYFSDFSIRLRVPPTACKVVHS